jgi:glutamine amidotransferase
MGNLRSVSKALEEAGAKVEVTASPAAVAAADALCVPGQGVFGRCMTNLRAGGLDATIRDWIAQDRPYLGICLGMQVLFETSSENGPVDGLGLVPGTVTRLPGGVRVPHIGWNEVNGEHYYFDHSYAVHPADTSIVDGWCEHGERFAASIATGSILGVQFHPEKSAAAGLALLKRWVDH